MKYIALIANLIILMTLICTTTQAQNTEPEYDLRPKWTAGQQSTYEFWNLRERTITVNFNGNSRDSSDSYVSEGETTWVVDQVNTDGSSQCRMRIDWMKVTLTGPTGESIVVDSRGSNPGEIEAFGKLLKAMSGKWLTYEIAPNGLVKSVTGMNQMTAQVQDPEDIPTELDFKESGSDLAQLIGAPPALRVGGSWRESFRWSNQIGLPGLESYLNYNTDYTLTSVENIEGIPVATVDGTARMTLEVDRSTIPPEAPPVDIQMTNSDFSTQILYDLNRSEAVGRNTTQNETIRVSISTPNGQLVQDFQTMHQGQILRISESKP